MRKMLGSGKISLFVYTHQRVYIRLIWCTYTPYMVYICRFCVVVIRIITSVNITHHRCYAVDACTLDRCTSTLGSFGSSMCSNA